MLSLFSHLSDRFNRLAIWNRTVRIRGHTLHGHSFDRFVYLLLHKWGLMGRSDRLAFDRIVQPGMQVIDVGANLGLFSLLLSSRVGPSGRVHAYEPVPELRECFSRAVQSNQVSNIEILPCAAGSADGELSMTLHSFNSGDHRARVTEQRGERSIRVPVVRLDHGFAPGSIDFIKIDVQGFEPEVLRGMTALLSAQRAPIVYFEISLTLLKKNAFTVEDAIRPLIEHRYAFSLWNDATANFSPVTPQELISRAHNFLYFNVLARPLGADAMAQNKTVA